MKKLLALCLSLLLPVFLLTGCHGARKQTGFAIPESFDESRRY